MEELARESTGLDALNALAGWFVGGGDDGGPRSRREVHAPVCIRVRQARSCHGPGGRYPTHRRCRRRRRNFFARGDLRDILDRNRHAGRASLPRPLRRREQRHPVRRTARVDRSRRERRNCLPTIVDDAEITELVVAADVEAPVLRGLDDPDGTGYLTKAVADGLLAMYGRVLPTPPQCLYSINLLVVPLWGLYANMLQLVSQVSSHVVVTIRKSVSAATESQEIELQLNPPTNDGVAPEKLGLHCFKLDYEASSKRCRLDVDGGIPLPQHYCYMWLLASFLLNRNLWTCWPSC